MLRSPSCAGAIEFAYDGRAYGDCERMGSVHAP
jgi:hypothetical protein